MATSTTTYGLLKPTVGADENTWGATINDDFDKIDDLLDGTTPIKPNLVVGQWKVDGAAVTLTAEELNQLGGLTAAQVALLQAITAAAAEVNLLKGATISTAELNYVKGVTSGIQAQINALSAPPTGMVAFFAQNSPPTGWLRANGAMVSRATYPALFLVLGNTYGAFTTTEFKLPDMRGRFARAWDDSGIVDPSRAFGSTQDDAFQGHWHNIGSADPDGLNQQVAGMEGSNNTSSPGNLVKIDSTPTLERIPYATNPRTDTSGSGAPRTAKETRPKNVSLLACIKH